MSKSGWRRFIRGHGALAVAAILALFPACDEAGDPVGTAGPDADAAEASGTVAPVGEALGEGQPLVVVDGVVQGDDVDMEELEALDIARIEVLKGPAAEELRGERASDGVIQITTKEAAAREGDGAAVPRSRSDDLKGTLQLRDDSPEPPLRLEDDPLIVVDGVIQADASMSDLKALDIASMEVVKGRAAERLYDERAANGVIQITTKDTGDGGG